METVGIPSLSALLQGQEAGTWVVLSPDMSQILSTAKTPEEALEKAHLGPEASGKTLDERPVMVQVPDPKMVCFL